MHCVDKADAGMAEDDADPLQEFKNAFAGSEGDEESNREEGEQAGSDAEEPAQKRQRIRVVNAKGAPSLTAKEDGVTGILDYPSDEALPPKH